MLSLFNTTCTMRKLATAALLFFSISVHAQQLFGNLNLKEALQRADEQGKLVFLQFESDDCQQCNDVADKGLSDEKLQAMLRVASRAAALEILQ